MSKLGFHVASPHRTGAGNLLDAGAPLVVMVDQNMIDEVHAAGAIAAYRTQHSPMGEDNPNQFMYFALDAMPSIASQWMNTLKPIWDLNPRADYYIVNNEQDISDISDAQKLNVFFQTCMTIADQWHIKIGICSFSTGNPTDDAGLSLEQRWQPMLPAIKQCADGGHVIILHAHCLNSDSMMSSGEAESLRHQRTLKYFASQNLYPKIIIGELSNGVGGVQPDLNSYIENVTWWDQQVMASSWRDQVIGGALYGFNAAESIATAVPTLAEWIANNPTPTTPPIEPPPPVSNYKSIIYLAPQVLSKAEAAEFDAVRDAVKGTATQSADDAVTINQSPAVALDSKIVVYKPSGWVDSIDAWLKGKGVKNIEYREFSSLVVPWLSQLGSTAAYAPGDCGAADVAMLANYHNQAITVDDVSKASGMPTGYLTLNSSQLIKAAAAFGLSLTFLTNQTLSSFQDILTDKQPMLALVNYAALPNRVKRDPLYSRGHWLLIVGITADSVIYHDPYETDESIGAYKTITQAEFLHAWSMLNSDFSIPNQILRLAKITPPPPSTTYFYSGVGQGNPSQLTADEFGAYKTSKLSAIKLLTTGDPGENAANVNMIRAYQPNAFIIGRLFFSVNPPSKFSPQQFVDFVTPGLSALYAAGVRYFEVHNEPNLPDEGLGFNWIDGAGFGNWLQSVLAILRPRYPLALWGYPGLSPQPNLPAFLTGSAAAIGACDFVCAHSYWNDAEFPMLTLSGGLSFRTVRDKAFGKPIMITECSNNNAAVAASVKGMEYAQYFAALKSEPSVSAAFVFALSWPGNDQNKEGWVENPGIPQALGA